MGGRPTRRKLTDYVKSFLETKLAQVKGGCTQAKNVWGSCGPLQVIPAVRGNRTLDTLDENLVRRYYNHLIGLDRDIRGSQKNLFNAFQNPGSVAVFGRLSR